MIRHWRSLRAQVLLWTVFPLTTLLLAVSLTGIGTHQASMRTLASADNAQLATAVASVLAQQVKSYVVGLEAAAHLTAHHSDEAMRNTLLDEASAILGGVEIVALDSAGVPIAASGEGRLDWVEPLPPPTDTGGMTITVVGELLLVRAPLPAEGGALIARIPLHLFAQGLEQVVAAGDGTVVELADGAVPLVQVGTAKVAGAEDVEHSADDWIVSSVAVAGTPWTVILRTPWHTSTLPLIRFPQAMPYVLVVAAVVSFLTLYFGLRLVVRPLRQLETRARQIGEGDFAAAANPVGGVDEIENVRAAMDQMAARLQSSQRSLERYLHATTQAQEEERARLARELHDETIQGLIALDHRMQKAQRALGREPSLLKNEVAELRGMVRTQMEEVRRFSRSLRPVYLEDLGLCPALELLSNESEAVYMMTGEQRRLDSTIELSLYRIAQESINNARRHAQAHRIDLLLAFTPTTVTLRVQDDGVGFNLPPHLGTLSREGHFGLMGIQERAELIGALLSIETAPGHGTQIIVSVNT